MLMMIASEVGKLLMMITSEAGKLVALDDFITWYRKMSFVRVRVEIDSSKSLKLGVSIHGQEGILWQPFMYEKMPSFYYI